MKSLDLSQASESLRDYIRDLADEPLLVTDHGEMIAALVPLVDESPLPEDLASDPNFLGLIERARDEYRHGHSQTSDQVRRSLGLG